MIKSSDFQKIFQNVYFLKLKAWQQLKVRFKFVRSIETQDDKKTGKLVVNSYGSRTYFKLEVKKDCEAILSLHQEDEDEYGVAKTRPNTDLGLVLMTKQDKVFKLVKFVEPRNQREIYYQTKLAKGEYYMVPKSFGRNVMGRKGFMGVGSVANEAELYKDAISQKRFMIMKENERHTNLGEDDFNERSQFVKSIIEDIFRKLDLENKRFLVKEDLVKIRRFFLPESKEMEFPKIIENFELKMVSNKPAPGLTIRGFQRFFKDMIRRNANVTQIQEMFKNLGYDSQLFSFKSRLVTFGLYSTENILVTNKDSLKGKRGLTGRQHRK